MAVGTLVRNQHRDPFSRYVGLSVIFHCTVVLVFTIKTVFFPSEDLQIRDAIRVDLIGLPDKAEPPKPKEVVQKQPQLRPRHRKSHRKSLHPKQKGSKGRPEQGEKQSGQGTGAFKGPSVD